MTLTDGRLPVVIRVGPLGRGHLALLSQRLCLCPQAGPSCGPGYRVCIIDEIGKMELFSQPFIQAVRQTLSSPGMIVLGTIPVPKGKPLALVEEIRNRRDVKVFNVSEPALGEPLLRAHIPAPRSSSPAFFWQWEGLGC